LFEKEKRQLKVRKEGKKREQENAYNKI